MTKAVPRHVIEALARSTRASGVPLRLDDRQAAELVAEALRPGVKRPTARRRDVAA